MSIRIERNEAGNCINFHGSSNPTYWNACLSGEVDPDVADTVNVVNDIITAQTGTKQYEFFRIPYQEFTDRDGNGFDSAEAAAAYITANANVVGLSGDGIDLIGKDICFDLDPTNTSILLSNGEHFGVNTIKAVPEGGHISIISTDASESITHYYNLEVGRACTGGSVIPGGLNDVINVLDELFSVGPFESVVISDPFSTMVANVDGEPSGYTLEGNTAADPVGDDIFTNSSSGNLAGLKSVATISQAGEYFTFDIRGEGQIGFGLVHTQESYDAGNFSGNSTYADPSTFAVTNSAHSGFQFSHWFHPTPDGSWTNYGANTSYSQREAWYSAATHFEARDEWLAGNPIKIKVGLDENGYISIASLADDNVTWKYHARTTYPALEGSEFHLGIKTANASAKVYTAPKVHLLDTSQPPTSLGTDAITVFGEGITGTLAGGIVSSASDGLDNDGFVSTQTINEVGEYFEFTWSAGGDFNFGLFSENVHDVSDLTSDTSDWGNDDYIFYGARAENNGSMTSVYVEGGEPYTVIGSTNDTSVSQYYGRVGFDGQGRATVWYSLDGTNWNVFHHAQASAASGDYKFIWIAQEAGAVLDTLQQGVIDTAPVMNFRYIESPDGVFQFPLFATLEEADYYIEQNGGTAGSGTTQLFPDDPTNTTWYLPYPYYNNNEPLAPIGESFLGNFVAYTEITTLTNADLLPPVFSSAALTVNELSSVNYQTQPQDTAYMTSFLNLPAGLVDNGGGIIGGTAPEVLLDNVANPSDEYVITVVRTNTHGSSQGTLTLTVANLTAPVITAITGFTHNASSTALAEEDIMDSGSVVTMDEDLKDLERLVVLKSFVETNVLPSLQQAGDKYYMGVLNSGADVSSVEDSDWDVAFVWEYQSLTSHQYRVIKDGVQQHHTGIGSRTVALFDYAIEINNGNTHMIACNANAINTEPSPEYGGTFSNATEVVLGETPPLTISLAYVGSASAKFATTGLSEIVTPAPDRWIQVTASPTHTLQFDSVSSMPTLQAGYTYRFLMGDTEYADLSTSTGLHADDDIRFTADGSTEYTTGITRVGNPNDTNTFGAHTAYVQFTVPSDVPPLQWYTDHNGIGSANGVNISGSTYVVPITGITKEGPAANQTGSNIMDAGDHGWISIDEQLGAGERLVLDNAFFTDFLSEVMDTNNVFAIGLKGDNWTNTKEVSNQQAATSGEFFKGDSYIVGVCYSGGTQVSMTIISNGSVGNSMLINTTALQQTVCAFIDITSSGNNIRMGLGRNGAYGVTQGDESTVAYADWNSYKGQTGDQGYGIAALDAVMSFWSFDGGDIDGSNIDWTGLSEINIPTPAVTNLTSWTKALDFSGSSERAAQVSSSANYMPIAMDGLSATVNPHSSQGSFSTVSGLTSDHIYSRPWATAIVFKADGNNSNQHIWNQGEGAGSNDDNIYLRLSATRHLYFGWGRDGALNECSIGYIGGNIGGWWSVYIAHTGARFSGGQATADNLAAAFDIRLMQGAGNWNVGANVSIPQGWTVNGGRMDRNVVGNFTIGGRGANRNFHGKVASMVVTTLRIDQPMPNDTEIATMVTDPRKWIQDYKDGNTYRVAHSQQEATFVAYDYLSNSAFSTQVWLMGDGNADNYSNMIRNQVYPNDQNYTKLNLISMVSNDIQNVTISGLS